MTTTPATVRQTASTTCACGCAPSMDTEATVAEAATPTESGCTCGSDETTGCGPECGCGSAS